MFHLWQNENPLISTNLSEPALYAVALPSEIISFGGIRPQGQYPASPLSASECVEAKQGIGKSEAPVTQVIGTIAATAITQSTGTNRFLQPSATRRSGRWAEYAGRTRSVAYPKQGMSLRGNDGLGHLSYANAMGASAIRSAMFAVMHG